MSTFTKYLTESAKSYDYKVKIVGDIDKDFTTRMETALGKFEVSKCSAGKKTPIQSLPLDFPAISNESVTIYDVTTNYPASVREMHEYLADYMRIPVAHIVVRKPGEPTEEYQETIANATKSEYKNKLQDIEYKDAPAVKHEEQFGNQYNMSLLKELLKNREVNKDAPKEKEHIQSKEEVGTPSPFPNANKGK